MNDDDMVLLVALDALPGDELASAERAIGADPQRRAELDELRAVLSVLAEAEAASPPPQLRARVLAAVERMPQDLPANGSLAPPVPLEGRPALTVIEGNDLGLRAPVVRRSSRSRSGLLTLSAAAAMVALVAGLVAWFALGRSSGESDEIAAVIENPAAETINLTGDVDGIRVVHVPGSDEAVLVGDALPDPGDERTYQLWFLSGATPAPSEVFRPGGDGDVEVLVDDFDEQARGYAVSTEPAGGSNEVTGGIVAMSG